MINEIMNSTGDRMGKTIDALRTDLMAIRTGRASTALVERLTVEYYNQPTPLQQLASISVPDAQTLTIRPYAPNDIPAIEKAIAKSDLGLTPNSDGQQIRLNIPALTESRRQELTRLVGKRAEEARVAIRNIRREEIKLLQELEKEGEISEDDLRRGQDDIQKITDKYIKQVDQISGEKEAEIMTI